jgi:serine/threonine-protein kinase PRP4
MNQSDNNNIVDGKEEDEDLEKLIVLEGEDLYSFESESQRSERLAEERRRQRRQRLAQVVRSSCNNDNDKDDQYLSNPPQKKTKLETTIEDDSRPTMATDNAMDDEKDDNEDDDGFDMFSDSLSPLETVNGNSRVITKTTAGNGRNQQQQQQQHDPDSWDDADGYYKAVIGEVMELDESADQNMQFRVAGLIGKGVFSTVLKCTVISNPSATPLPPVVALKLIRRNETMAKAALTELAMLQTLTGSPGIVELVVPPKHPPTEYRGHIVLVFGFYEYNLRDVLQKFGKSVGLSIAAVRSYFGQLLSALSHLKKHKIIHADLKPDNILVSQDFGTVRLGDFGSAMMAEDSLTSSSGTMGGGGPQPAATPVPYLVSRFYRAPEIILGLVPNYTIDLWSLAVSMAELFLGDLVFRGRSNNDMLYVFMQHLGPISNRVIRQHLVACSRSAMTLMPHFVSKGTIYYFRQHTTDPVTGDIVYKELSLTTKTTSSNDTVSTVFPNATPLTQRILKSQSATDTKKLVRQFCQLLLQCLALDPTRRISLKEALQHEFFQSPSATTNTST